MCRRLVASEWLWFSVWLQKCKAVNQWVSLVLDWAKFVQVVEGVVLKTSMLRTNTKFQREITCEVRWKTHQSESALATRSQWIQKE